MEYINRFITRFLRIVRYYRWKINVRFTSPIPCSGKEKITVIVPSYNILRVHNLEHLIRSVLRYNGVEKVIVSNHNPLIRLENHIHSKDERITLINQEERRGCGYAWVVASQQTADYFLIIDFSAADPVNGLNQKLRFVLAFKNPRQDSRGSSGSGWRIEQTKQSFKTKLLFRVHRIESE